MPRKKVRKLYKTTIVVYSEYDPKKANMEMSDLVMDAETGESIVATSGTKVVTFASAPQGVREFFTDPQDDEWVTPV